METSTKSKGRQQDSSGNNPAARAARRWLGRQLRWESRLTELRTNAPTR
jgi:hypothetical protein